MSMISIRRPHRLSPEDVRCTAEAVAQRIERRHAVRWAWRGDALELIAPPGIAGGARGRVTIGDSDVAIEIHLPLALSPMRRMVERRLSAKLDELLGAA
jgi:putative polyhydroxyalkanoate system protein